MLKRAKYVTYEKEAIIVAEGAETPQRIYQVVQGVCRIEKSVHTYSSEPPLSPPREEEEQIEFPLTPRNSSKTDKGFNLLTEITSIRKGSFDF
jgi:hypothetical protein